MILGKSRVFLIAFVAWLAWRGLTAAWIHIDERIPAQLENARVAANETEDERVRRTLGNKYGLFAYIVTHVPEGGLLLAQLPGEAAATGPVGRLLLRIQLLLYPRQMRFFLKPEDLQTGRTIDLANTWYLQYYAADAVVQPDRWELVDETQPFRIWKVTSPPR